MTAGLQCYYLEHQLPSPEYMGSQRRGSVTSLSRSSARRAWQRITEVKLCCLFTIYSAASWQPWLRWPSMPSMAGFAVAMGLFPFKSQVENLWTLSCTGGCCPVCSVWHPSVVPFLHPSWAISPHPLFPGIAPIISSFSLPQFPCRKSWWKVPVDLL